MSDMTLNITPDGEIDSASYHEACDRTYLVTNLAESALSEHIVFQKHKELGDKIGQIIDMLSEIYQITGNLDHMKSLEDEITNNQGV